MPKAQPTSDMARTQAGHELDGHPPHIGLQQRRLARRMGQSWKVNFVTIWTGQALSLLGSQLVSFALIWYLTQTTQSAAVLATASLAGLLPPVLLGPFAGALIDRWNRRRTMIVADASIALATVGLALLFGLGIVRTWHIYLLLLLRAVGASFQQPAMLASTSLMVPEEHLTRVQGLNQTLEGGLNIISAPLGAVLLAVLPMQGILAIDVATAALAIALLALVRIPQPKRAREAGAAPSLALVLGDMAEGLRYVLSWTGLALILAMASLLNALFNPAFALLPLLVSQHFQSGALQLSWLNTALGVGLVAGGVVLSVWGGFRRRILTMVLGLVGIGFAMLVVGLAPASALNLATGAMFLLGVNLALTNGPFMAAIQASVEPSIQGRVITLLHSICSAASPLGLIVAGPLGDLVGVQAWYVLSAGMCFVMAAAGVLVPQVLHFEDRRALLPTAVRA